MVKVINLIKIIKNDLYKKIYSVLDDKYVPLLNKKLYLNGSKDDLVNFLVENYSENEIFDLINNTKEELFNSTYNMLDNISFELLLEEFSSIKSKNELVNYLNNNYDKNGILKLIDKLKMDLSDEISMNLNQNLVLFIREKYSLKNYSKDDLINYLIENYLKAEIFDLIKINRMELFKIIYSNLDDNSVLLLNKKLSFTGSKKDLVNILIDNYSEYETSQLIDSAKKDLFNKLDALIDDEILKVMQHSGNQSKEDFLEKLIDEYNEKEILEKIENAKIIVRKNKVDKFNLMIGENTFINLKSYLHFDGNKQDLINYLVDNYSESKVKNEINQANQSARKKLIRKLNIIIDKELAEFISYKFSIVNYTKKRVINYLINNYSENKVLPLVHQIKNSNGFKVYVKLDQKNINALSKKYSIFPKKDKVIKYLISHYSDEEILYEYNWSQTNKNL